MKEYIHTIMICIAIIVAALIIRSAILEHAQDMGGFMFQIIR